LVGLTSTEISRSTSEIDRVSGGDWIDELSAAWSREYPDVDTSALPPLVRVARLAVLIEGFQSEVVGAFGLTPSDYSVLAALRRAGRPYALNPSQLYSRLQRSSGGMTKMLKRLEERGLVEREPDPQDGRGSVISLTRKGQRLQDRTFQAFLTRSQEVLAPLSATRRREVERSLRSLVDAFESHLGS
jgi:DNA-binding MarR family transcriptional regulator